MLQAVMPRTGPSFYDLRLYARILPVRPSLDRALDLGYLPAHIICMQGPFTTELNAAMFRQTGARYVVTKNSGRTGGFQEKLEAPASACHRPGWAMPQ